MSAAPTYTAELELALSIAAEAGKMIKTASAKRWQVASQSQQSGSNEPATKKNSVDLVTETDQAVEKLVIERISSTFPDHKFIGEESYAGGERPDLTDAPTWIVDPIDGTTNFVHGFPFVCISIGFCVDKIPTVGVIYNPFLDQLYQAVRGHGAFLNTHTQLPLSHPNPLPLAGLGEALIAVEWGSDRSGEIIEKKALSLKKLAADGKTVPGGKMAHSLRSMGSAALNFAHVATGQLDLYQEIGCWSWDVCAAVCIAREAGCKVFGRKGGVFDGKALMGHHFFVIRAIAPTADESGEAIQDRLAKEYFETVEDWDV